MNAFSSVYRSLVIAAVITNTAQVFNNSYGLYNMYLVQPTLHLALSFHPSDFASTFEQGPNSCSDVNGQLLARLYTNTDLPNPLPSTNNNNAAFHSSNKPFVFASGSGGCVDEWLQAGRNNTADQFATILDIGYTPAQRCRDIKSAQNATLLVWNPQTDDGLIWATWDNVVPYIAQLYGVDMSQAVVKPQLLYATPYADFAANPQYTVEYQNALGNDYCESTRALDGHFMKNALTMDPTGVKFRAALEACFSFYDVFQGNGYGQS